MRYALALFLGLLFVAWVDAQQTAALTAGERKKQLQENRKLVEKLVGNSVALAGANSPLDRAVACRNAMAELYRSLDAAIASQDPSRVSELGDYFASIVTDALMPNLTAAKSVCPEGSADRAKLVDLHKSATEDLTKLESSVPRTDALGRSSQVKETQAKWQAASKQLSNALKD